VFEGIRGEKSRDPESESVLSAEKDATARASETGEGPPKDKSQKAEGGDNVTEVQLRQRTAKLERQIAEMGPWAQLGVALQQAPGGQQIIAKLQQGQALTAGEQQTLEDAQGDQPEERPLTRAELNEALNMRDAAKTQIDEIHSVAREKFADYDKIRKNPQFLGFMDATLGAVWNGSIPIHEDAKDWTDVQAARNFTAIASAHELYLMRNPKVAAALKEAGRKEADERNAEKLAASSMSSRTSTSSSDEKSMTSEERIKNAMLNARGVGKSFAKLGRGR
jgi:hypothetical protein